MVGLGRLELPTSPLSGVRSNQLSYKPVLAAAFCPMSRLAFLTLSVTYYSYAPSLARHPAYLEQKSLQQLFISLSGQTLYTTVAL